MTTTYTTREEAVRREILDRIAESIYYGNEDRFTPCARSPYELVTAEYDVNAIAAEVLGSDAEGYAPLVDEDEFWEAVDRHTR